MMAKVQLGAAFTIRFRVRCRARCRVRDRVEGRVIVRVRVRIRIRKVEGPGSLHKDHIHALGAPDLELGFQHFRMTRFQCIRISRCFGRPVSVIRDDPRCHGQAFN